MKQQLYVPMTFLEVKEILEWKTALKQRGSTTYSHKTVFVCLAEEKKKVDKIFRQKPQTILGTIASGSVECLAHFTDFT